MLRHLSKHVIQHLTLLLNAILKLGYFPTIWKATKVIPLHKPNKPSEDANSYRPISLLISISKLLERIIASRLTTFINRLTPNDLYMSRTTPLTSKRCILYIYSTNIGTEYFKHALYSPFFSLQNAVCFIMLTCLFPVLFTFYIQDVLKLKKK